MGDEVGDSAHTQSHMSADDLNDGFILDKDDKKTLAYQVRDNTKCRVCVFIYLWNTLHFFMIWMLMRKVFYLSFCLSRMENGTLERSLREMGMEMQKRERVVRRRNQRQRRKMEMMMMMKMMGKKKAKKRNRRAAMVKKKKKKMVTLTWTLNKKVKMRRENRRIKTLVLNRRRV